jgi:serine/threonine protein kinase
MRAQYSKDGQRAEERSQPTSGGRCSHEGPRRGTGALAGLCPKCLLDQGLLKPAATFRQPFTPPPLESLAKSIPGVELIEMVGQGGMGAVYKGRQYLLNRLVAVKVLPPTGADGGSIASRFGQEARALARLSHPNIVAIHEYGLVGALPYFTMDYVEGVTVRQMLKEKRLDYRTAVTLFLQVCEGLQHAHERGVVHRDIKPENILVDRRGRAKIADFGIARLDGEVEASRRQTVQGQWLGTPHYMAPEQLVRSHDVDHRADIYSAGVLLYEMLTGELPLGRFPPPSRIAKTARQLDGVIFKALENRPSHRFHDMRRFKLAVEAAVAGKALNVARALRAREDGSLLAEADKLEKALERQPDNSDKLEALKDLYNRIGSEDAVIRISERLSNAYRRQGRWAAAILENQNLLLRLPTDSPAAKRIHHDTGNMNSHLEGLEKLVEFRPDDYRFLEMLKHSYSLLDIDDKHDRFSRMLARAYVRKEKWELAIKEYREVLHRDPNDGDAAEALAELEAQIARTAGDSALAQPGDRLPLQ